MWLLCSINKGIIGIPVFLDNEWNIFDERHNIRYMTGVRDHLKWAFEPNRYALVHDCDNGYSRPEDDKVPLTPHSLCH